MEEPGVSELASTLQFGSINRHPSPRHDLNPSTAASQKQPVTLDKNADIDSDIDEDEIPTSILNPVPRKQTMPPLPDLRFEQSYLKSIEKAESWQGVAWITLRDQVGSLRVKASWTTCLHIAGSYVLCAGRGVDTHSQRMAALEQVGQVQRAECWCKDTKVVVGRQQLVYSRCEVEAEGHKAGKECLRGECCLPRGLASCRSAAPRARNRMLTIASVLQE